MVRSSGRIVARSSFLQQLFYLFSCKRVVTFEREKRYIEIYRKTWWFKKASDFVCYDQVSDVSFGFEDWNDFGFEFWQDGYEKIWVSLELKNSDELVPLVCFEGEGSRETGIFGTLLGDSIFDFRGNQQALASEFYNTVKDELGMWSR
ncbi:hypothetical protein DDZ13_10065 [Coraliomargarita sinensis]|uniref:Uncharacterized protein n=1 Tax=Coraliomargarita sinensis TaxID=2174842 RepID=A0A317ZID3_9BACT|nr:hypothetical protein DDZ13_10065 [Coraliomargarita sinensis]